MPPKTTFARFLSAKRGAIVARYGTATPRSRAIQLGVTVAADGSLTWDEDEVHALSPAEAELYAREYDGHVERGELAARTEDDYLAWLEAQRERAAETIAKLEAESEATTKTEESAAL